MRIRSLAIGLALIACLSVAFFATAAAAEVVVENCLVSAIDDVDVPAEESGVLIELPAKPGQEVKEDDLLGKIDDKMAVIAREAAQNEYDRHKKRSENDISVRFAKKSYEVALADLASNEAANAEVPGAVPETEMRTKRLKTEETKLGIEQATVTQGLIEFDVRKALGEWHAANDAVKRRRILSPIEGEVFEVHRNRGEWVQSGETVIRVVHMSRLQIHGFLNEAKHSRDSVMNHPIKVTVKMDGGRSEIFTGKIVFASSETTGGGEFRVSAEVDNRKENDRWLLKPGQLATMTIE